VAVDAGPDDVQALRLGPISPELVLVDPVLAEQARKLLPDPVAPPRRPRPAPVVASETVDVVEQTEALPEPRRRLRRTVALAVVVFAAGATFGTFLGGRQPSSPGVTFEALTGAPGAQPPTGDARNSAPTAQPTTGRTALRPPRVVSPKHRRANVVRASNVLGVEARVGSRAVTLVWHRPANSAHVVVLRARGAGGRGTAVFRGRAASYRDASLRRCTAYRYTIVNYDRRGHPSTGIPTSVVTPGCG